MPRIQGIGLQLAGTLLAVCTGFEASAGGMFLGDTADLGSPVPANEPTGLVVTWPQDPGDPRFREQPMEFQYRAEFQWFRPLPLTFTPLTNVPEPTATVVGTGLACLVFAAAYRKRRSV